MEFDPTDKGFIERSGLSVRAKNALRLAGHRSLSECRALTIDRLLTIENIGRKTAIEILDYLENFKQHELEEARGSNQVHGVVKYTPVDRAYLARILSLPLTELRFSVRAANSLKAARINTLLDLVTKSSKLTKVPNCGKKTWAELDDVAKILGLELGTSFDKDTLNEIRNYQAINAKRNHLEEIKNKYSDRYELIIQARIRHIPPERIRYVRDIYRLYQQEGTLARVAQLKNLTRERIRQLLVKGTKWGLFRYSGREYPYVEKEQILKSYSECLSLNRVAGMLGIPYNSLQLLITAHKITKNDLGSIRVSSQKKSCIDTFRRIEAELGRPPTTADLQNNRKWRYLSVRIAKLWGPFDNFREELSIPKPVHKLPEATRKWLENKRRLGLAIRMQYLDQIKEALINTGPLSCSEIAYECGIKPPKALRFLGLLIATGKVVRLGEGSNTKYSIECEGVRNEDSF